MMGYLENFLCCSFGFYAVTGLALGYLASYFLLKTVAYLSPWIPVWMWFADFGLFIHAIGIAATSTVGVIAVLANKSHALKLCTYILVSLFLVEILASVQLATRKSSLVNALHYDLKKEMQISQTHYSFNISDTQMWDEIQFEVNCCGVVSYKDWLGTLYGKHANVPDSCCLLITKGCGLNIVSNPHPDDLIVTEGCLPTIMNDLGKAYYYYGYHVWLPVLGAQFIMIIIIIYIVRKIAANKPSYYPYILPPDNLFPKSDSKYKPLEEEDHSHY